jgi:hypothetical protein
MCRLLSWGEDSCLWQNIDQIRPGFRPVSLRQVNLAAFPFGLAAGGGRRNLNAFDQDQSGWPASAVICVYRRAEARLAKHSSETSTGADLPTR